MTNITKNIEPGQLFVVATPIGNLHDMSPRAVAVLQAVDLIAAEDTRHSKPLMHHFNIQTPLTAYHEFNEAKKAQNLIQVLMQGKSIAIISDAGTPIISDPGFVLIRLVHEHGIKVVPIPGACAAIAALSAAGLPCDRFCFEGFLPVKTKQRLNYLQKFATETRTMVFYESPHRIVETMQAMLEAFGAERQITIARELTKIYETIRTDAIEAILQWMLDDTNQQKGEFVIIVQGAPAKAETMEMSIHIEKLLKILLNKLSLKEAVAVVVEITDYPKNLIYQKALALK